MIVFICACNQKTEYGTSIAFRNQLSDTINVKLYPKETLYAYETSYQIEASGSEDIYWVSGQQEAPGEILEAVFDSIVISYNDQTILYSKDTIIGCNANLYHEDDLWESKIEEYDTPDNFNRNPHEDIVYTFSLTEGMLLED